MSPAAPLIADPALKQLAGLRHGFFTRHGGVSGGVYASLNCGPGSDDDLDHVRENQARAARSLGARAKNLVTAHQVHGAAVAVVDKPWPAADRPEADGLVTNRPGIALAVLTADCAPVLLADAEAGVIGAAHAGWRGALAGVLEATVAAMAELGAEAGRIVARVGPCIGPYSYEVGPEFPKPFLDESPANAVFFAPAERDGHFAFGLPGYAVSKLARAGVKQAQAIGRDTLAEEDDFFSYRRATLRGEESYGRNLSAIMMVEN